MLIAPVDDITCRRVGRARPTRTMCNITGVTREFDAVVIGAGVVGAACAYFLAVQGASSRSSTAAGWPVEPRARGRATSSSPTRSRAGARAGAALEPDLARAERRAGRSRRARAQGRLVVAGLNGGRRRARCLRRSPARGPACRPSRWPPRRWSSSSRTSPGGSAVASSYPQDSRSQPMLAAAHLLAAARRHRAELLPDCEGDRNRPWGRGRGRSRRGPSTGG